jgi:hypothetical protein
MRRARRKFLQKAISLNLCLTRNPCLSIRNSSETTLSCPLSLYSVSLPVSLLTYWPAVEPNHSIACFSGSPWQSTFLSRSLHQQRMVWKGRSGWQTGYCFLSLQKQSWGPGNRHAGVEAWEGDRARDLPSQQKRSKTHPFRTARRLPRC